MVGARFLHSVCSCCWWCGCNLTCSIIQFIL